MEAELRSIFSQFGIEDKVWIITTDSAKNMEKLGRIMKDDIGDDDYEEDELTDEEVEAILDALKTYDEVKESEDELHILENNVDEEHRNFVRRISIWRLPCTSHSLALVYF